MRKKTLLMTIVLLMSAVVRVMAADVKTVTFVNDANWAKVFVWAWNDTENFTGGQWPGVELTATDATNNYNWSINGNPTKIIFSNGEGAQTSDLDFVDGGVYNSHGLVASLQKFTATLKSSTLNEVWAYVWKGNDNALGPWPGTKMEGANGTFTIEIQAAEAPTNIIFNNGNNGLQTEDLEFTDGMVYEWNPEVTVTPILTLKGEVGKEVTLKFGVYDTEDEFSVDFGDGNLLTAKVGIDNKGPKDEVTGETPTATEFTGTVAGDGTIKVYGNNNIWYYNTSGNVLPTAFNQAKLMNVVQMSISGADVESVSLPAYEKLEQFSFTNSSVKSLDVTNVPTLTRIDIFNTTVSEYEPQLESIDLSQNVNLDMLVLGGNTYKKGALTALDVTNNTKLTQISAENNKIASVTGIAATVKNIYLSNNELASLTLPEFTQKGNIQIQNNKFTLATLPTKPAVTSTSKYTYAPQPAYAVAEEVSELDLSSQLTATGVLAEPATTTYSFVTEGGTALVEGEDYEVASPGVFKFIKAQSEKVHGVMATAAFPKFTGANAYVTTEFTVTLPAPAPDYYLVGTMTNWVDDGVYDAYKLTKNEMAEGEEYMISLDLTTTDQFKVVKKDGENLTWYPYGTPNYGENGEITANSNYTIYFRPNGDGGDDWFYHVIYAVNNTPDAISTLSPAAAQDAVIYNMAGQRVMNAQKGLYIINGKKVMR